MMVVKAMLGARSVGLRAGGERDPTGTTATLSWPRLIDHLRQSGAIRLDEDAAAIVISDDGIEIRLVGR